MSGGTPAGGATAARPLEARFPQKTGLLLPVKRIGKDYRKHRTGLGGVRSIDARGGRFIDVLGGGGVRFIDAGGVRSNVDNFNKSQPCPPGQHERKACTRILFGVVAPCGREWSCPSATPKPCVLAPKTLHGGVRSNGVRLTESAFFVADGRGRRLQHQPASDLLHLGLWVHGQRSLQSRKKLLLEVLVRVFALVLLRELLPQ